MTRALPPGAWDTEYHAPVLMDEVLSLLGGRALVLDGTLGGGGHTAALLESGANVVALDRDPRALEAASRRISDALEEGRFRPVLANYSDIEIEPALAGLKFHGILLDLGISSHQIDDADRGFTFRPGAPLDMRMGPDADQDAAALLSEMHESELARVFREYGDEPRAGRLAREIVRRRARAPFQTSDHLVAAIRGALGARTGPADFARLFQAVRIAVNRELDGLERALPALRDRLEPDGVIAVISYHSGEDRIVKRAFRDWDDPCVCPPRQPFCVCGQVPLGATITRKAITPSDEERERNTRARSARLRAWQRAA